MPSSGQHSGIYQQDDWRHSYYTFIPKSKLFHLRCLCTFFCGSTKPCSMPQNILYLQPQSSWYFNLMNIHFIHHTVLIYYYYRHNQKSWQFIISIRNTHCGPINIIHDSRCGWRGRITPNNYIHPAICADMSPQEQQQEQEQKAKVNR